MNFSPGKLWNGLVDNPCTDGERVYAVFGDGSFAALDNRGETVWVNR